MNTHVGPKRSVVLAAYVVLLVIALVLLGCGVAPSPEVTPPVGTSRAAAAETR